MLGKDVGESAAMEHPKHGAGCPGDKEHGSNPASQRLEAGTEGADASYEQS